MYDEPLAMTAADEAHYDNCPSCKAGFERIANDARATGVLLTLPTFESQPRQALAQLRVRIREDETNRPVRWHERWLGGALIRRRFAGPVGVVLVAGALLVAFTATGVLPSLVKVFEPRTMTPVSVSPGGMVTTTRVLDYGTVSWNPAPPSAEQVADGATASSRSGLPLLLPATLPPGVSGPVNYGVISHAVGSLTFDSARLRTSAASQGVKVGPMPADIDHSTIYISAGPALVELWGGSGAPGGGGSPPTLVIAQTRIPTVESTGASTKQLEDYLLSQPGVPPELAAQLRAIKDPSTTLPVPIPAGLATTKSVSINGVSGLLIDAGIASGVVWQKGNVIYAVGGQLTPDQVVALASSLR
ncbi:MAG: hypothetical protein M3077_02065 [Candidatus Dormibacteraeota bacterium]|nr:hypothetical protein [Candidatus Dormibacteraeota bacterium]